MDIKRRKRKWKMTSIVIFAVSFISVAILYIMDWGKALPEFKRENFWIGKVRRGDFKIQIYASGILVSEKYERITSTNDGIIENIIVRTGDMVTRGTPMIVMKNNELEQSEEDARLQLLMAQDEFTIKQKNLELDKLQREADLVSVKMAYQQAKYDENNTNLLAQEGLISLVDLERAKAKEQEYRNKLETEEKRFEKFEEIISAQKRANQSKIKQLDGVWQLRKRQLESLNVRASMDGIVHQIDVEIGQRVSIGNYLAKISKTDFLKAELNIPESKAKEIRLGQDVHIESAMGRATGAVCRIDPAVKQGTVLVDVCFKKRLTEPFLPEQNIQGFIDIDEQQNVLFVEKPVNIQSGVNSSIYKLSADNTRAIKVFAVFGRSSSREIVILKGLQAGDNIILSDTSDVEKYDQFLLK